MLMMCKRGLYILHIEYPLRENSKNTFKVRLYQMCACVSMIHLLTQAALPSRLLQNKKKGKKKSG